ncbi:Glycerol kinase [Giardia lamblia P15]|uniref:glycerol kinase n=1 Tax=Giardia intestinalis (strain P15) TaxID=658858 RepID=E1F4Y0_GIAIA|nr:Glycerol kinase [Giardia lamblia P15]
MATNSYLLAIDQGTTSTRIILFDRAGKSVASSTRSNYSVTPNEGWVEQDPKRIINDVYECLSDVSYKAQELGIQRDSIRACGITTQRETVIIWDESTGEPLYNAVVWSDARNRELITELEKTYGPIIRIRTGLPLSTYFTAGKVLWLYQNIPTVKEAIKNCTAKIGTMDTWLLWNLSRERSYLTDVTAASRTQFFNIETMAWDPMLLHIFSVSTEVLPVVWPSAGGVFGTLSEAAGWLEGLQIGSMIGDQQASMVGHRCFTTGSSKITFGTGAFLLINAGVTKPEPDDNLLITICYQESPTARPVYAREASIASAGSIFEWLRTMGMIKSVTDIDSLVKPLMDETSSVVFVPAFTGLLCPFWCPHARAGIFNLSYSTTPSHIVKAAMEAVALQIRDILPLFQELDNMPNALNIGVAMARINSQNSLSEAMAIEALDQSNDLALPVRPGRQIRIDGGLTKSEHFSQILSDVTQCAILVSRNQELTSLGCAILAGLTSQIYRDLSDAEASIESSFSTFSPKKSTSQAAELYNKWQIAIKKTM